MNDNNGQYKNCICRRLWHFWKALDALDLAPSRKAAAVLSFSDSAPVNLVAQSDIRLLDEYITDLFASGLLGKRKEYV